MTPMKELTTIVINLKVNNREEPTTTLNSSTIVLTMLVKIPAMKVIYFLKRSWSKSISHSFKSSSSCHFPSQL